MSQADCCFVSEPSAISLRPSISLEVSWASFPLSNLLQSVELTFNSRNVPFLRPNQSEQQTARDALRRSYSRVVRNCTTLRASLGLLTLPSRTSYSMALNVTGGLTTTLIDYVGTEHPTTLSGKTLSFKLTQDVFATSLIGNTTDEAVQVTYQLKEAAAPRLRVEGRWVGIGLTAALVLLFL
jgi:hypothetical protein